MGSVDKISIVVNGQPLTVDQISVLLEALSEHQANVMKQHTIEDPIGKHICARILLDIRNLKSILFRIKV